MMKLAEIFADYLGHLFSGRRQEARELILTAQDRGMPAEELLQKIIWPAMEQVQHLYHSDEIPLIVEHMAARINRLVADQLQGLLARQLKTGQRMVVVCGNGENEELGAQITADLFEASGWMVWFLGAGVPNDEILEFLGQAEPDVLCMFGTHPTGAPDARRLIDLIREVGICQEMQILASGGVFNRADGLADEIGADLFAATAGDALEAVRVHPTRVPKPDVPQPGRRRKRKKAQTTEVRPHRVGSLDDAHPDITDSGDDPLGLDEA